MNKLQISHDRLYWELHDIVKCIRDGQLGDYSPLMDEIFDSEDAMLKSREFLKTNKFQESLPNPKEDENEEYIKNLSINGLSVKDVKIFYWIDSYNVEFTTFAFFFIIDGKCEDFYYGNHGLSFEQWNEFIPLYFHENCENEYGFRGLEEGLNQLRKCGYNNFQHVDNPDFFDWTTAMSNSDYYEEANHLEMKDD